MEKTITLFTGETSFPAYLTTEQNKAQAIILIHEIWGLNNHIKDVSQRLKKEGYTVLAPDLFTGTPVEGKFTEFAIVRVRKAKSREEAESLMSPVLSVINSPEFKEKTVKRLKKCFAYLKDQGCSKIAVMGFCFGGTYSFLLAAAEPELSACIPFYGQSPIAENAKKISCPILAFYGENDTRLIEALPAFKKEMKKYHKNFEAIIYPRCGHAFFNDTNPAAYNKEASKDAWKRLLRFFAIYVKHEK
ncbi:MAG: dienelactone hydrolase family protein [Patescibacteria group bacterium]|nr:dienelactone hydrolase family protein [Patescibacteria group bacterium]